MNLKKKLTVLLTLVALFMTVPATYSTLDAITPAKKTATSKKKSSAKSNSKPFKGWWASKSSYDTVFIDINLYNPNNYGTIGYSSMSKVDDHEIIEVESINGNTAIVVTECPFSGKTCRGKLTYNPNNGRMSYSPLSDHGMCYIGGGIKSIPRKKK